SRMSVSIVASSNLFPTVRVAAALQVVQGRGFSMSVALDAASATLHRAGCRLTDEVVSEAGAPLGEHNFVDAGFLPHQCVERLAGSREATHPIPRRGSRDERERSKSLS